MIIIIYTNINNMQLDVMDKALNLSKQKFLDHLYRDNYAWLFAWLYKSLQQRHDTEDVLQSTFVKVLSSEFRSIKHPKAFLAKIATRIVIDQQRRKQIEQAYLAYLSTQNLQDSSSPEAMLLAVELFERITMMLQGLDQLSQKIFLLSYIDHMSQAEIAQQLHLSRRQVQYALIKALQHCDQILAAD